MVKPLMEALRGKDYAVRGFAAGPAARGIGTARAFTLDTLACTFAGIALGLDAVVTAVLARLVLGWFERRASVPSARACDTIER